MDKYGPWQYNNNKNAENANDDKEDPNKNTGGSTGDNRNSGPRKDTVYNSHWEDETEAVSKEECLIKVCGYNIPGYVPP